MGRQGRQVWSYAALAEEIRGRPARCGSVRLVAVDGPGGSGKSVFASRLAAHLDGAPVIATDDFASWDSPITWWDRFERDVLAPLERGSPIRYRAYDWISRRPGDWLEVEPGELVLVEGVSSARRAAATRLSYVVWIEARRDERLRRGLARDGEAMRETWGRWMIEEDHHFALDGTIDRADLLVDGAPTQVHDPDTQFVALARGLGR